MNLNPNVVNLLAVLIAANALLIGVVAVRSMFRRRRPVVAGPPQPRTDFAGSPALSRSAVSFEELTDSARSTNRTDPLTGLLLPTEWNRIVADEDARIGRYGHRATIVIIEVAGLDKLINVLGRDAGDRVLPAVADAISRNARGADHLARLGPGRFGVLLPETGEVEAVNYVERVRQVCDLWLESGAIALQLAIGWASPNNESTLGDALILATDRMYSELRRDARRATDVAPEDVPPAHDVEESPAPV